jgi:hypothetical protein
MPPIESARFLAGIGRPLIGIKQAVPIANPAAGADWQTKVPGGEQWHILVGHYLLTTSAAVANRVINLQILIDGLLIWNVVDGTAVAASQTRTHNLLRSYAPSNTAASVTISNLPIPDVWLPPGATIGTITSAIDVADQYSQINLYVERFYLTDQELNIFAEDREAMIRAYVDQAGKGH